MLGVAASATPGAEAARSGAPRGFLHDPQWWGLYAASTVLMLICYGGILRQQLALARGTRLPIYDSMKQAVVGLPGTLGVVVPVTLAVAAGIAALVLPGFVVLVFGFFAWVAQIDARLPPLAAIRRSIDEVRGRFLATAGIVAATIAAILVFVLLSGILLAVVMNLAGIGARNRAYRFVVIPLADGGRAVAAGGLCRCGDRGCVERGGATPRLIRRAPALRSPQHPGRGRGDRQ